MKVIAHRGASGLVDVENTLEAFEKAVEIKADMVEFDVRKTKDNVLVVFHDKNFQDVPIGWLTYEEMEKRANAQGFHVPLLKEVLKLLAGRIYLDIEVKEHGFEKRLVNMLHKYLKTETYSVKSFDDRVVYKVKELDPNIKTGLLLGMEKATVKRRINELFPERRLKACHADFVSPNYQLLHFGFIQRMHLKQYEIYVWTVNEAKLIDKLLKTSIEGIITDRPDIVFEQMRIGDKG